MRDWNKSRWDWKRAVRANSRLNDRAKLLACSLCDDFANSKAPFCNPKIETLTDALGKSVRAVQRAVVELREAGWIAIEQVRGSKAPPEFQFTNSPIFGFNESAETVARMSEYGHKSGDSAVATRAKSGDSFGKSGDRSVASPTPPIRNNHILTTSRAIGLASKRPSPQCQFFVKRGSDGETAWNAWLDRVGHPSLPILDQRLGDGWNLPGRYPPTDPHGIDWRIAEKWEIWAVYLLEERACA